MEVIPLGSGARQMVEAYRPGGFRVAGRDVQGSVLVFAERTLPWPVSDPAALSETVLAPVIDADPPVDVVLIGCGERMVQLPTSLTARLRAAGIGADSMSTAAACRTYNVLVSEGRGVAAALIAL
ncbi:MAG: hypothetical protein HKM95_17255 [Inquilinus sp.]|nr:hypothetical protein [Inquilinus sp.]